MEARAKINQIIEEKKKETEILESLAYAIEAAYRLIRDALKKDRKILICGNGGSAADAQHFAAELVGRYLKEREPLQAIALTTDTSILTAVSNDYGFVQVFARQVRAHGRAGDILFAISTSGNSENVIEAIKAARQKEMRVISLLGKDGGKTRGLADIEIIVPLQKTPRIQELHESIIHTICELLDDAE